MDVHERIMVLENALSKLQGFSNTPMGILATLPDGVDDDIWALGTKFENAIEDRISFLKLMYND